MCNLCKTKKSTLGTVLKVLGGIVVVAGIAYAVYRWVWPMISEKLADEFDDEFDEDFFDDDDYIVDIFEDSEEVVLPEETPAEEV